MHRDLSFKDRLHAGQMLAELLVRRSYLAPVVVVGLPRGGVPVAAVVAKKLGAPLDILMVRKIGAPGHEELACGAVASGGITVWNEGVMRSLGLHRSDLAQSLARERAILEQREREIRADGSHARELKGHTVVLVDDGVATGASMRAAIRAVLATKPHQVVVALPVGAADTCDELEREEGCEVECLACVPSERFGSVGEWYDDFSQITTEQCRSWLLQSAKPESPARGVG